MANRYMKRFSTSLIIREMQIKTTVKSNLTLIRMTMIRKMENNKCWQGYRETGILCTIGGNLRWYGHYGKRVWTVLKKLKIDI